MRHEDVPEAWIDAAAAGGQPKPTATWDPAYGSFDLPAAIAAVYPLIRDAVIEECARVADAQGWDRFGGDDDDGNGADYSDHQQGWCNGADTVAQQIRALEDQP